MQASAPAYTAVAARQTLHRPLPTTESPKQPKISWSPEVRQYVQRAFNQDNAIPGIDAEAMQEKLKFLITQAAETGHLSSIDWSTYPLPQHIIRQERDQTALAGAQDAKIANVNTSSITPFAQRSEILASSKKRKSPENGSLEPTPPWKKTSPGPALEDRTVGKSKNQEKKQKKINAMRANFVNKDADALEKRRLRFGHISPEPSPSHLQRGSFADERPRNGPLVGTCQQLEKNYFRLTAPPEPGTVRPLPILKQALEMIRKRWKKEHNYTYACDQLKSLRQDLTVQHIQNEFTVQVYEVHARIALEMADLGEYNQCQTQLRALYKLNLGGKPEEFTAYRILYIIFTCNRTDMNDVLADLTSADKQKPGVQHALQVRSALASGNYHRFFRLYDEAPFMGGYLLDMFVERERLAALAAICKA